MTRASARARLIEEFSRWVRAQGAAVLTARSWAVEGSLAYAPVTAWLRSAPLRPLLDSLDDVWLSEISRLLPELLADHPGLAAPAPMLESWQRQRLFEAVARAVASARTRPLLVLDDANWADSDTLEWLHFMLRTAAVTGFVILGVRSGEVESNRSLAALVSDARDRGELLDIELGPLSEAETAMPRRRDVGSAARCSGTRTPVPRDRRSSAVRGGDGPVRARRHCRVATPRELREADGCRYRLA